MSQFYGNRRESVVSSGSSGNDDSKSPLAVSPFAEDEDRAPLLGGGAGAGQGAGAGVGEDVVSSDHKAPSSTSDKQTSDKSSGAEAGASSDKGKGGFFSSLFGGSKGSSGKEPEKQAKGGPETEGSGPRALLNKLLPKAEPDELPKGEPVVITVPGAQKNNRRIRSGRIVKRKEKPEGEAEVKAGEETSITPKEQTASEDERQGQLCLNEKKLIGVQAPDGSSFLGYLSGRETRIRWGFSGVLWDLRLRASGSAS